jgi:lipopolysaccharide/colanic/teichoic acid biosynthesis glycosyltransferase
MPDDNLNKPARFRPLVLMAALAMAALSSGLGLLAWQLAGGSFGKWPPDPTRAQQFLMGFGLFAAHALIALLLIRFLRILLGRQSNPWACRLGFLLSLGLSLARWLAYLPPHPQQASLTDVAAGFLGAWLGGLLATALEVGLWENNFPPSPEVEADVLRIHRARLGKPSPPSRSKRVFDFTLSLLGLILSLPLWVLITLLIWFSDPGPQFFVKNSVGKDGVNYRQWKFRTMIQNAEEATGPIVSNRSDIRVLLIGRFLRRTALDELPQLVNILLGEMSFVGPRPQRTVVVHNYLQTMPEYADRHCVAPGLSGLAQVAGKPYRTPRQKLRYDRIYAQHANLGFDLKLLMLAFAIVFWFRWTPNWQGSVPRAWLRWGASRPPSMKT